MKKAILLFVSILVVFIVGDVFFKTKKTTNSNVGIKVSAIINLTGSAAQFDAIKQKSLDTAIERLKILYPDLDIALNIYDAGGSPETTAVAIKKSSEWGAAYYLSGTSPTALAIASQVRNSPVPTVQMANAANPEFGPPKRGEYRLWPDWNQEGELVTNLLKSLQLKRILVVYSADPYSESLKRKLEYELSNQKNTIAIYQQYDPGSAPDFRPALLHAKSSEVQAVIIFGLPPGIKNFISQLQQVNWDKVVIGGININLNIDDFAKTGLPGPLWALRTSTMDGELPPETESFAFRALFKKNYGIEPPFHALYIADGLYLIAAANYDKKQTDPVRAIQTVKEFNSASGLITISGNGILRYQITAQKVFPQ